MSTALWALVGVLVLGMLLRMPIGFSMLVSGFAYLLVKRQDLGLVADQWATACTTATCCWPCRCLCLLPTS
jgi:hypothetical protein